MTSVLRNPKTDCLLIGFNDQNFEEYTQMTRSMGMDSGAYRDLNLAFIEYEGKPMRSIDLLNHFYFENKSGQPKPFHNADFLWPVITVLGSYLAQRGFAFDYVNLFHLEKEKLKEKLKANDILTISITTTLYVSPYPILEIVSFIRQYNNTAKIILGGPYLSNQVKMADSETIQNMFKYLGADFYVDSSEGEFALANIIQAIKARVSFDCIDNIAYKDGDRYKVTQTSTESNSLEENPVNYSLFSKGEYGEFVTLRTAKSCPFSCSFCGFPQRAGKYTYVGVDLIEKEFNSIADIGTISTLTFIDDTFNVPKGRFKDILRMMIRNKYGFKWNSYLRSDHADEECIELMGESGCEGVFLGVESGSDAMLERMNKTSRRKDYLRVIPLLKQYGISTHASLIVGFPGETYDTNQETIDFLEEAKPDFFRTQLWYCDPTTPIWNEREKYGVKGSAFNWSHDTMDVKTACDLINRAFVAVNDSLWLPQNGFDQWSTFYLQRKGMAMDQIKTFVRCFNALVKKKLICSEKKELDPTLLANLKASCQFDNPAEIDTIPMDILSGANYVAAEKYWISQFNGEAPASNLDKVRSDGSSTKEGHALVPCVIDSSTLEKIAANCDADFSEIILTAYSILLSHLDGLEDTLIVSAISRQSGDSVVPVRLRPYWELSFDQFVRCVRQNLQQAIDHKVYAFHILTNPLRMARLGCSSPSFSAGYTYCEVGGDRKGIEIEDALKHYTHVSREISLVLNAAKEGDDLKLHFSFVKSWFRIETIEKLSSYLSSILKELSKNPAIKLEEIMLDINATAGQMAVGADNSEVFHF